MVNKFFGDKNFNEATYGPEFEIVSDNVDLVYDTEEVQSIAQDMFGVATSNFDPHSADDFISLYL